MFHGPKPLSFHYLCPIIKLTIVHYMGFYPTPSLPLPVVCFRALMFPICTVREGRELPNIFKNLEQNLTKKMIESEIIIMNFFNLSTKLISINYNVIMLSLWRYDYTTYLLWGPNCKSHISLSKKTLFWLMYRSKGHKIFYWIFLILNEYIKV